MTKEELAAKLDGREYLEEITDAEEADAKAAGLLVIFGYSDDNVELRGAINDEVGAWEGTEIMLTRDGLLQDWDHMIQNCTEESDFEAYFKAKAAGWKKVEAKWCATDDVSWTFVTGVPHATFNILDGGDTFCVGIVLSKADL
jgi:hypothetical protein